MTFIIQYNFMLGTLFKSILKCYCDHAIKCFNAHKKMI